MDDIPKPKRRWLRRLLVVVTFLGVLLHALLFIPSSRLYSEKAIYSQMPADDVSLERWLKDQQGVVPHTVHTSRQGNAIRASFIMVRDGHGRPAFPNLSKACESLSYAGRQADWHDNWSN
jgi:hypothetical protein